MTELERNKKIKEEIDRISVFFEECPENVKSILLPLIQNAGFMRVALDDLQETIAREGPVDHYQNGQHQFGTKQSAALQAYVALQKTYLMTIKNLAQYLPPEKKQAFTPWQPRQKTDEEWEAERQEEDARLKKLNADIAKVTERQRREREIS